MSTGKHRLVKQVEGRGMFAIVGVEVNPAAGFSVAMHPELVAAPNVVAPFEGAARAGIEYAWEKASAKWAGGAAVMIRELTVLPVDTTTVQVMYAAALAMWEAMGESADLPVVTEGRKFTFVG